MKTTIHTLGFSLLAGAVALIAARGVAAPRADIDADVAAAVDELIAVNPGVQGLFDDAEGVLIIPDVLKAGLVVGGAYGEGALLVDGFTDSYWSYTAASIGYQAGAQSTRQAMFFLTDEALAKFEENGGYEVGADAEITVINSGAELAVDTTADSADPIVVIVYGREGLLAGASLQGGSYARLDVDQ